MLLLYFYLTLLANILNKFYFLFADRVQVGMDSDSSDPMAPDEMYLMLQADMVCTYTFYDLLIRMYVILSQ